MPTSPIFYHSGLAVILAISVLAVVASLLTIFTSTLALVLYRRTVAKLMSSHADESDLPAATDTPPKPASSSIQQDAESIITPPPVLSGIKQDANHLLRLTITEPRRHAIKYTLAGIAFALLMGLSSYFAFSQPYVNFLRAASHPLQLVFMTWTFAWPVVLTINTVAINSRWNKWLIVLGYFVILIVLAGVLALSPTEAPFQANNISLPAWSGDTPFRLLARWNLFNLTPTLLFIVFRNRRLRAVAPLVLSFMTVISTGVLGIITAAFIYQDASNAAILLASERLGMSEPVAFIGYFLLLIIIASLLFGVFGWWLLKWIRNGYLRKTISDQSLEVDALWLVFAAFYAVILAFAGPGWALSALVSYIIYKIVVTAGNRWLMKKNNSYSPALLILRVFALGKRSEPLFNIVSKRWRYIGNIRLIAGTDLALATVAPQQFLAFVSGKISQLFIRDKSSMLRSLTGLDTRRDHDGRYRINDYFCHANTWQRVLSELVKSTDVVLMDLRSFSANNAGCIFEIKELLDTVPLRRLIFAIDNTTDREFLTAMLDESCRKLRPGSPNLGISAADVQPIMLKSDRHEELLGLIRQLCMIVSSESESMN